ncbi:MAG: hypothetical protein J6A05_05175, partial [Oscillospiraceae bacterium]|nr:hypothetical protein [Oscillospiraceae bacterium]
MKQFNKSKFCALVTTAAVFMSNTAVLPSINAFAADGDAKTATITLTDNWSKTLTYEDIPQAEEKTTTVTLNLNPNWSGSIDFTGVDTENGERRYFAEGENYNFDFGESYDDIVAAIEANGIDLPEYPVFWLNDITISYNWKFTPADGTTTTDVMINSGA